MFLNLTILKRAMSLWCMIKRLHCERSGTWNHLSDYWQCVLCSAVTHRVFVHISLKISKQTSAQTEQTNIYTFFDYKYYWVTGYLQNILQLSYDNANATIDLRLSSGLQNIFCRTQGCIQAWFTFFKWSFIGIYYTLSQLPQIRTFGDNGPYYYRPNNLHVIRVWKCYHQPQKPTTNHIFSSNVNWISREVSLHIANKLSPNKSDIYMPWPKTETPNSSQ